MKKGVGVFSAFFIMALLLVAPFGYAAGTSEGGDTASDEATVSDADVSDAVVSYPSDAARTASGAEIDCEDPSTFTSRRDRIKCRITPENKGRVRATATSKVHESCRNLADSATASGQLSLEDCRKYYNRLYSDRCYDLPNADKVACFKRAAGLGTAAVSGDAEKGAVRKYIVSLLYELEERLEHAVEDGRLDADAAAEVIDFIVEIKEDIMNGESRDVVKPKLQELREQLKELRGSVDE